MLAKSSFSENKFSRCLSCSKLKSVFLNPLYLFALAEEGGFGGIPKIY